ncbi:MAG: 4Fe-4S binding protein [Anaerolineae bacterium]|nr:4Fe-4S binding protein [Anaerolineae bacterium]
MTQTPYQHLAARLDALPNGFPAAADGAEIRLLKHLYTPEEAALAAQLRITKETPAQIAERTGGDARDLRKTLKDMAKRGLIAVDRIEGGVGYGLLPFVVGVYEFQLERLDAELAQLFEDYYQQAFGQTSAIEPQVHRVIPVNESIAITMEIHPHESAAAIVNNAQAWGAVDCICRKQKALIGDPCDHPRDNCMIFSDTPGAFDQAKSVRALTQAEALTLLHQAAAAGLVHTSGNYREGLSYICNCCTCSCGILRSMSEMGIANAVARSAFVAVVDADSCGGCENCTTVCQFDALDLQADGVMGVNRVRCVGCGVCTVACPDDALHLVRRPDEEIKPIPATHHEWDTARAMARGLNLDDIL